MRLTYLDEAGTAQHEPYFVVAAIIIEADKQLAAVERHLDEIMAKHIPEQDRVGFVYHATDIWSGKKYFKDRTMWPLAKRLAILDDLAQTPAIFDIPISFACFIKERWNDARLPRKATAGEKDEAIHTVTFARCCDGVEMFMRKCAPDEITMLIAEARPAIERSLKSVLLIFKNSDAMKLNEFEPGEFTPYEKIRESVYFSIKDESRALQLADTCCFFLRAYAAKTPNTERYYKILLPQMLYVPTAPTDPALAVMV
jgi:hypothetical protein